MQTDGNRVSFKISIPEYRVHPTAILKNKVVGKLRKCREFKLCHHSDTELIIYFACSLTCF